MDPAALQRLTRYGDQSLLLFYSNCVSDQAKHPTLTLAEVMCVHATKSSSEEVNAALWKLVHGTETPTQRVTVTLPSSPVQSSTAGKQMKDRFRHGKGERGKPYQRPIEKPKNSAELLPQIDFGKGRYFLMGDSQMVRFAKYLGFSTGFVSGALQAGPMCRSGSRLTDVIDFLKTGCHGKPDVVLMIGVNDCLKNRPMEQLTAHIKTMVGFLKRKCDKVVIMEVPRVAREPKDTAVNKSILYYNFKLAWIVKTEPNIKFLKVSNSLSDDMIHKQYKDGKPDNIHINDKGFAMLRGLLCDMEK